MSLLLGCSGWSYNEWVGYIYETKTESKLRAYSEIFGTAEIDSTFYAMPKKGLVFGWLKYTPDDFIFTAKIPQTITHKMKLEASKELEKELNDFLNLMKPLNGKGKLGCLLIQLPPKLKFKAETVEAFFQILSKDFRYCIEFRNKTWMVEESFKLLEKYNIGYTIVDEPLLPPEVHITSDIAYIRWHGYGSRIWYDYHYTEEELKPWIPKIKEVSKKAKKVYGYFNNHFHGYAPENCLDILNMLGISTPKQEETREEIKKNRRSEKPSKVTLEDFIEKDSTLTDYLRQFLSEPRLIRAKGIEDKLVNVELIDSDHIGAKVKDYFVRIDIKGRAIEHNCDDWSKQLKNKNFCKHLAKLFLFIDKKISLKLLKDIAENRQKWNFSYVEE